MGIKSALFCAIVAITCVSAVDFQKNIMLNTIDTIKEWHTYSSNRLEKNELCTKQLTALLELLEKNVAEGRFMTDNWAWRMVDSMNKLNSGILTGNTLGTGNMDECLAIDEQIEGSMEIKGKYCYPGLAVPLEEKPKNLLKVSRLLNNTRQPQVFMPENYFMALCIPHECSVQDLFPKMVDLGDVCQTTDTYKEWDGGDWSFIAFISVIALFVVASTIYDWYIRSKNLKPAHPITLAFSFYTNGEKLLQLSKNPEQISCMHGIRTLSMMLVMAGHRFSITFSIGLTNLEQALEWTEDPLSMYVQGAPVAVDSFMFLTGVLMAYSFMKTQSKPKARFNIPLFYLHRYLRLTPAVAVLWFFYVTVYKHTSSGPMWPLLTKGNVESCLEHPYSYFLYIQNFVNPNSICMMHTWYLSLDMQIFIFSPVILIPMAKYPKYAGYALVGAIFLSVLPPILITYFMNIVAYGWDYNRHYYYQPYTRLSPWLVGILLGYIFYQTRDKKIKISRPVNLFIWTFIMAGMILILYFGCDMNLTDDVLSFAFYSGLHRMFWAVGLMWIVFACHRGYGGIVNWFLSLPPFEILGKLSYSMYLLHAVVQMMILLNKRTPFHFTQYEVLSQCFSDIITVSGLAFLFCLMFESPMVVVEKIIFGGASKPRSLETSQPQEVSKVQEDDKQTAVA